MQDILSLILTIVGCIIFIQLLPALVWLFVMIMIIAFLYTTYQRYKYVRAQKEMQKNGTYQQSTYTNTNTSNTSNSDVIDVEYTESEEDIS